MRNKLIKLQSNRLFSEMKTFIWHNGRPQAMRGYNDDLVMSFAIGCWVRDTVLIENQHGLEYSKQFISAMSSNETKFATTIPGQLGHRKTELVEQGTAAKMFNDQYMTIIKG